MRALFFCFFLLLLFLESEAYICLVFQPKQLSLELMRLVVPVRRRDLTNFRKKLSVQRTGAFVGSNGSAQEAVTRI